MIQAILPAIVSLIGNTIDKAVPDKNLAAEIKAKATLSAFEHDSKELEGAIQIIKAEAQGESWLQRNWRPVLMMWFAALIGAHWLGLTPENLTQESIDMLLSIVQLGIGGYVIGRSAEKIVREYKK